MTQPSILGSLLGTAVGDSLGLPYEGLSRKRVAAFGKLRHRFLLGRGMFSDDTEHTLMLAAARLPWALLFGPVGAGWKSLM